MRYNKKIIDSHIHFWDSGQIFAWINGHSSVFEHIAGEYSRIRRDFLPADFLAAFQKHNVMQCVHVEASRFEKDAVNETKWLQGLSEEIGFPQAIIAFANLADPNVEDVLKAHCQFPNMRGIRMILNHDDDAKICMTDRADYLHDKQWRKGFALLSKYQLSFDLQIYDHQAQNAYDFAQSFPQTTIILEHFGWPTDISENGFNLWKERMSLFAKSQNISIKLSAAGLVFQDKGEQWLNKYIHAAIQIFGVDRCMYGSNFPVDNLFYSADELIGIFKNALSSYSLDDQRKIFYQNAALIYRLL